MSVSHFIGSDLLHRFLGGFAIGCAFVLLGGTELIHGIF